MRGKLSAEEVETIKTRLATGEAPAAIACEVPVHKRRIELIQQGRTWRDKPAARRSEDDVSLPDREAIARLAARAVRDAETGCTVWQGARNEAGYGQITYKRRNWSAHRLAWVAEHGPVPGGLCVRHTCANRACIALAHLVLGDLGRS